MANARPPLRQAGFTLAELLVAMAILVIIVLTATKILSTAANITTVNNKRMDANDQARMIFDRMANDFACIVRRNDVDVIFWKNSNSTRPNDTMFFYTEGAGYFDTSAYPTIPTGASLGTEKNSVSLVGYRVNDYSNVSLTIVPTTAQDSDYYQLERLGKSLSWDGGAYNSGQPNFMTFLTYPPAGTDASSKDSVGYSTAFFNSTIWGAFSNTSSTQSGGPPSAVGTEGKNFNDGTDPYYRSIGTQVFRFEYSFQLKDGTFSDKPMMVKTTANGLPFSFITATATSQHPSPKDDSSNTAGDGTFAVGSRWWDSGDHIGFICVDATPYYAIWHEIGLQDISAIIVTIAVIDKQGLLFVNNKKGNMAKIAGALLDYSPTVNWPLATSPAGNPAYLLDPSVSSAPASWAYALLPSKTVSTTAIAGVGVTSTKLPQSMISQIRLYQRYFYLNTF